MLGIKAILDTTTVGAFLGSRTTLTHLWGVWYHREAPSLCLQDTVESSPTPLAQITWHLDFCSGCCCVS